MAKITVKRRDFRNSQGSDTRVTVRELIAALAEFPPDCEVYLCSGETGSPGYVTHIKTRSSKTLGNIVTLHRR